MLSGRAELPDNDQIEDAVKEYITVFCGDTCNRLSWLRCAGGFGLDGAHG
jgi:hypothetical protein